MNNRSLGRRKRLSVYTVSLGCPKNRVDTEHLLGSLGCEIHPVAHPGRAAVILINTCGFITPAVQESVHTILDLAERVRSCRRKPLLVVAGCLVGRYGIEELAREIPEVDLWLTTRDLPFWPKLLLAALGEHEEHWQEGRFLSTSPYAWLKIGEGCRHSCSFCTIPLIRGPLRSVPEQKLLDEAEGLVADGIREIDLVAQDVTSWRGENGESLIHLLDRLQSIPGLLWLRMLYLYPQGITDELLHYIATSSSPLLPYFDIPLQHAHPDVLKRMGRPFASDPRVVLDKVMELVPKAVLRTTFIVGFPGETETQFEALCRFVDEEYFQHVGVFAYQREEGSRAYDFPDQVPEEIALQRKETLLSLQREVSEKKLSACLGSRMEVLVDSVNEEWPGLHNGRVWFQAPEVDGQTYISGPDVAPGVCVTAEVTENTAYDLSALA